MNLIHYLHKPLHGNEWLKKFLRIMKLTNLLLLVTALNVFSSNIHSQNTPLNVNMKNVPIKEVLNYIEDNSDYFFFYSSKMVDVNQHVDINSTNTPISEILDAVFKDTDIKYVIKDKQILLIDKETTLNSVSQQSQIEGKVTDSNSGEALAGVNIIIEGTLIGTVTGIDGKFTIQKPNNNEVVVFSFIGYISQKVTYTGQQTLAVKLALDVTTLDEIIVIGYGTQKKSDLTGSVARVSMDKKSGLSLSNISQAMSGSVSGMNVTGSSGLAGSDPDIAIRGQTSLSATDAPLIVLDGIIFNGSITNININDVETIDILKDASSAAVYGSRSANGVMLITTKKGKSQKPVISFSGYYGYQDMVNNPVKVMNGEQYAIRNVDYAWEQSLYAWYGTHPTSNAGRPVYPVDISDRNAVATRMKYPEEPANYLAGKEIKWIDEVQQIAPIQDYNLSIAGKGDRVNYFVSGSYTDETGIQINDAYKRLTFRANLESDITDWLKIGFNSSYTFRDYSGLPASLSNAMTASPWANNHIGSSVYDIDVCADYWQHYPFDDMHVTDVDTRDNQVLTGRSIITVPWVKGLTYEFNYSHTSDGTINNTFGAATTRTGQANFGYASKSSTDEKNWIMNNIISYNRTFAIVHRLSATFLYSRENRKANSTIAAASQFANSSLGFNNLGLGVIPTASSSAWEENSISYMARVNYIYKDRYIFTGTVRRDGYSGFGPDNKSATFPSASFAWVTSEEPFFKNLASWLYLKERISWGINGNQGIGRYSSFSRMAATSYIYGATTASGLSPSSLGNATLKWETTASTNFGIDWGLFNKRITGSIDMYSSKTHDVLVQRSLPTATGYSSVWSNLGQIDNKGIEIELTSKNLNGKLNWETNFVFSLNKDKIVKLYGGENDMDIGNSWFVGKPISSIYDYKMVDGTVWTENDLYSGNILSGWYPGQFKLVDQNGDGTIDPTNDRKIIGYADPLYRFSIRNSLSYKNFAFSFFINSIQGGENHYLMNNSYFLLIPAGDGALRMNQMAIRQYWTPDNGVTNASGMYTNPPRSSGLYQSRSFVRLQDVSLSYTLNASVLKKLKINACQFYIASKNPYIWTKWDGFDPEIAIKNPDPLRGYFASMRNITVGIRMTL
jgi:TonB-linked SusC/RagA family outer membrane protein